MKLRAEIADEKKIWNEIVEEANATIFHRWEWLKTFETFSGYTFEPYILYNKKTPAGVMPIFTINKFKLKFSFSPPPHSAIPFLGFAFSKYSSLKQNKKEGLIQESCKLINKLSETSTSFSMILHPEIPDVRPFLWEGYEVKPTYHYVIDLSPGEKTLLNNFKGSARKSIKKGMSMFEIKEGGLKELKTILELMRKRYIDQKRKVKVPFEYIYEVYNKFEDNFQILTAEFEGETIGGVINILDGSKVYSWLGNTKSNISGVYPNDLLMWESIKRACSDGYKLFYEIGANTPHLITYKSRFNPELVICFSVSKEKFLGKVARKTYTSVSKYVGL
ncbi:Acetyltransferase {GNAT} domain [Geoglobus ahangari]|uniref:Acetyltransferase (GNAT) domain n=1 Tax=Geoglobus ahangari TaxID=113653 RepID=A0A0F7IFW5_9EURY|nr:GNAT family N-acetyltransferase [Geoglobus ahangari]AKG92427.1 Acetyltransferase {GNAT} domain [Geoglobus ahangari]